MGVNRRFLLKGMALSGIAGLTMNSWGATMAPAAVSATAIGAAPPLTKLLLVKQSAAAPIFLQGAMAGCAAQRQLAVNPVELQRGGCDLAFLSGFERELRSGQPLRVIGLLDDAAATLVIDVARSAGARVQWLGQHTTAAGLTRHHLLNTDLAEGCAQQLSQQLQACGAGFSLQEERQHGPVKPRQFMGQARIADQSAQWASSVGYLLASLGMNPAGTAPLARPTSTPITSSFVSFSIQA